MGYVVPEIKMAMSIHQGRFLDLEKFREQSIGYLILDPICEYGYEYYEK